MICAIARVICIYSQRFGMSKKTSITLDENSYLFLIKHGKRNEYVEKLIKKRFQKLRSFLFFLKDRYEEKDISELLEDISLPVYFWEKKNRNIQPALKDALLGLWEEVADTGITPNELLAILNNEEHNDG